MSKVALNIAGKTLAGDLKKSHEGSVALIHPGVVSYSHRAAGTRLQYCKEKLHESNDGSFEALCIPSRMRVELIKWPCQHMYYLRIRVTAFLR